VYWLEPIAGIGESSGRDNRHRIRKERLLHLLLDVDIANRHNHVVVDMAVIGIGLGILAVWGFVTHAAVSLAGSPAGLT